MFTKKKHTGTIHGFKTVIDWGAVGGTIAVGFVALVILANLG